ncbi:MAG: hypothetical protein HY954_11205 [Deltaproteobacteria bacterium]|nr:hypothetical protein [Deltaproteobacteria bacterium]
MKKRLAAILQATVFLLPVAAYGYPNGTPQYVTDSGPFCASCHSSVMAGYMPELPPDVAKKELPEQKHYALVRMPTLPSPYVELTPEDKERLINKAKLIDSNSAVSITARSKVKAGGELTVTVKARGGNGPVIGIMLVDRALRYQARPVSSDGWLVTGEPEVIGQDGKIQKAWLDKRIKGTPRNLNFVLIEGERFDPERNLYPEGMVTYALKAPSAPGAYTLTAVLLYGTENTDKAGFFQRPSGRILFSEEIKVEVE